MGSEPEVVLTSYQRDTENPHCKTDVGNTRMDRIGNH